MRTIAGLREYGGADLHVNGQRLTLSNDEAYNFIIAVADGDLNDVPGIAVRIRHAIKPR